MRSGGPWRQHAETVHPSLLHTASVPQAARGASVNKPKKRHAGPRDDDEVFDWATLESTMPAPRASSRIAEPSMPPGYRTASAKHQAALSALAAVIVNQNLSLESFLVSDALNLLRITARARSNRPAYVRALAGRSSI